MMAKQVASLAVFAFVAALAGTQLQQAVVADDGAPPTPVFATNYHVRGILSLP